MEQYHKLFSRKKKERIHPNSFCYHDTKKADKDITKLQTNILYEYRCKNLQQNASKPNFGIYKKNYISQPSWGNWE